MNLNELSPAVGSKKAKIRVGRGIGSGIGKTCGKGHKGQKARAGGFHKIHFEGGQMPIQRRLPKMGFTSKLSRQNSEIALSTIAALQEEIIDLETLKKHKPIPGEKTADPYVIKARIADDKKLFMLSAVFVSRQFGFPQVLLKPMIQIRKNGKR